MEAGRAVARLQFSNGNIVVTATELLSDGLLVHLQLGAGCQAGWKERFRIVFQGLPGKTRGRARKHGLFIPSLLLCTELSHPWETGSRLHRSISKLSWVVLAMA